MLPTHSAVSVVLRFFLLSSLLVGATCAAEAGKADASPLHAVGASAREFNDPSRTNWAGSGPRPVRVTLWYPSDDGGTPEVADVDGRRWSMQREGGISPLRERYPLVLVSHGSGGNVAQMLWLGYFLAGSGYIVAAVDHNGTADEELQRARPTLTDFFGWERARDVSVVLDRLLAEPLLAARIDPARVFAAGFSLGGTTALWTAGARLDLASLQRNSPPPPAVIAEAIAERIAFAETNPVGLQSVARANDSYRDPRIKAVFALAPPMGVGFSADGLRAIDVPVFILVGDADVVAPAEANARHFAAHIPSARLEVVPGERGHYLKPISAEQRAEELLEVARMALAFLEGQGGR